MMQVMSNIMIQESKGMEAHTHILARAFSLRDVNFFHQALHLIILCFSFIVPISSEGMQWLNEFILLECVVVL